MFKRRLFWLAALLLLALLSIVALPRGAMAAADDCTKDCMETIKAQLVECQQRYGGADDLEKRRICLEDARGQYQSCAAGCGSGAATGKSGNPNNINSPGDEGNPGDKKGNPGDS